LFKSLPLSEHPALAKAFRLQKYHDKQIIVEQGDSGDVFFCIKRGKVKVIVDEVEVSKLGVGDYFGEQALLNDLPRNATIQADGLFECLELVRSDFEGLGFKSKLKFKGRKAVVQGLGSCYAHKTGATPKTPEEASMIRESLRINKNIGPTLEGLGDEALEEVVETAFHLDVTAENSEVITQGDLEADLFYILEKGSGEAIKDGVKVASYSTAGDSFGGLALLYSAPRAATVRVFPGSRLWCIPRRAMRHVFQAKVRQQVEKYAEILNEVECLNDVPIADKLTLADRLVEVTFFKDEVIMKEGDRECRAFYILKTGELGIVASMTPRDIAPFNIMAEEGSDELPYFGEHALIDDEPRMRTVHVVSEKATLLVLTREIYQKELKRCQQALQEKNDRLRQEVGALRKQLSLPDLHSEVVKPEHEMPSQEVVGHDFDRLEDICLLGCGGFGRVSLVKDSMTGHIFALKALSKGHILKECQQDSVLNEKKILRMTHSPFLIQCAATFNMNHHLYFLLEPAMGGELFTVFMKNNLHGNEHAGQFYTACVLKGLEHLHERCIIYRDMKPENLLLDDRGYCKIADFGLAKFVIGKTFTTCGTPDYFAPEVLKGIGHTSALDWWCLGVLLYEFMTAVTPFQADDPAMLFNKLMKGIECVPFPRTWTRQSSFASNSSEGTWKCLVKALCKMEPSERLAVRPGGTTNVMNHPWYTEAKFDWPGLVNRTMAAPWEPTLKSMDGSNFDPSEEDAPPIIPYVDPGDGWDADFEDRYGPATFH
jgi:cGMP-dependent protein kinase